MRMIGIGVLVGALALAGCEKDSGLPSKTSGAPRKHEAELLAQLPGGNVGLFGGNYYRFQEYLQSSAFSKLMKTMDAISPGMKAYSECFAQSGRDMKMLGALAYTDGTLTMRFVMKGFAVPQIQACAQKAGFPTTVDPDGKFVTIEMTGPQGPTRSGFLVLADGSLLSRQTMQLPMTTMPTPTTRAELEADVASLAKGTAADDQALVAELARIDRDRAMWFVGDLSSTPAGDKVGAVRGWADLGGGIAFDLSVQVKDAAMADKVAEGIPEMKKQADMLGKEVAGVIRGLRFERKGDRLRFAIKISDAQLEAMMAKLAAFMPQGAAGGM